MKKMHDLQNFLPTRNWKYTHYTAHMYVYVLVRLITGAKEEEKLTFSVYPRSFSAQLCRVGNVLN
jgi:hypothetical protein